MWQSYFFLPGLTELDKTGLDWTGLDWTGHAQARQARGNFYELLLDMRAGKGELLLGMRTMESN